MQGVLRKPYNIGRVNGTRFKKENVLYRTDGWFFAAGSYATLTATSHFRHVYSIQSRRYTARCIDVQSTVNDTLIPSASAESAKKATVIGNRWKLWVSEWTVGGWPWKGCLVAKFYTDNFAGVHYASDIEHTQIFWCDVLSQRSWNLHQVRFSGIPFSSFARMPWCSILLTSIKRKLY